MNNEINPIEEDFNEALSRYKAGQDLIPIVQDFQKIIKSCYLRTRKELWELPLHGCIRNELLMCLKVFLECLEVIWILFFEKTIKIPGLTHLWPRPAKALTKVMLPIFGSRTKLSSSWSPRWRNEITSVFLWRNLLCI